MERRAQEAERLRRLPYHIVLMRDAEGDEERCWAARVQEFPGCEARARTSEEAARAISDAMEDWLDAALQKGAEIPEPRRPSTHSGRLPLRIPPGLHSEMARRAEGEDVSLNGYITSLLASTVGSPGELGRAASGGAAPGPKGGPPPTTRPRFLSVAILANIVVVLIAAIAAVVLLVEALQNGW